MLHLLVIAAITAASGLATAADVASNGFVVRQERTIEAPPARVYDALLQPGSWWNPQHTYSRDSRNLSIDARPGGCFCERLPNGGVEHLRVVYLNRSEMIRLVGGLGPLQASAISGAMTWRVSPAASGTKFELIYNVSGMWPGGFDAIAPAVEGMLGEQVDRLKRLVETGAALAVKPAP